MKHTEEESYEYMIFELCPEQSHEKEASIQTDKVTWQTYIQNALQTLHGLFGLAVETEVLRTDGVRALVKVPREDSAKLRSAMTVYQPNLGMFGLEHIQCRFSITQATEESVL